MKALEGFYHVLGLPSESSIEQVKEAFLKKSYSSLPERFSLIFYQLSSVENFEVLGLVIYNEVKTFAKFFINERYQLVLIMETD